MRLTGVGISANAAYTVSNRPASTAFRGEQEVDRVDLSPAAPAEIPLETKSLKGWLLAGLVPAQGIPLGGLPASLPLNLLKWPDPAMREVENHLKELGLSPTAGAPEVARAELQEAQKLDSRIQAGDFARAIERADAATRLRPNAHRSLFGFSRLIDAKFRLTPGLLSSLAETVAEDQKGRREFLQMVDQGPQDGSPLWQHPETPRQLVASLIRHMVLGQGASLQIGLDHKLAAWLEDQLDESTEFKQAMGGAGAFAANISAALPEVEGRFWSPERLPERVAANFAPGVLAVTGQGDVAPPREWVEPSQQDRVNYVAEYRKGETFQLFGQDSASFEGDSKKLEISGSSRVILGTPSQFVPGFCQTSPETAAHIAREHEVFFVSGAHYLTKGDSAAKIQDFAQNLKAMKKANPRLLRHNQYAVPKKPAQEAALYKELKGAFDSMSLNAVEMAGLLHRLDQAGEADWKGDPYPDPTTAEQESFKLETALSLKSALGLSRIQVHGRNSDILILDQVKDVERQIQALLRCRQIANMKTANPSGEIRGPQDLWPVLPVVNADALAALYEFADGVCRRFGLSPEQHQAIVRDWHYTDPGSGQTIIFSPTRQLHERVGGTVSLGDTIDYTALAHGYEF